MPTPALPPRYRRRALATAERLAAAGRRTSAARYGPGLAERRLALLLGRQRFLRSGELPLDEA